ncbi:MAG: N-acetylmuramoyl-L-alanine amidase [Pseudomonadota bacterium]
MIRLVIALVLLATGAFAQVKVDPDRTSVSDGWWSLEVDVGLDGIVPFRVFTLDAPRRLVVDFEGADFSDVVPDSILSGDRASDVRIGPLRPGWARMVVDLAEPLVVAQAGMRRSDGGADLNIVLEQATEAEFIAAAGAPPDPGWQQVTAFDPKDAQRLAETTDLVVVIDPGHGGIDPGALGGGIKESDLMLLLGAELAVTLNRLDGVQSVLTRRDDSFLPLAGRLTLARSVGADLFLSLHADALDDPNVRGATVYTLSQGDDDAATKRLVERHARSDLLAGVDLNAAEDRVATALMGLARAETGPAAQRFADALVRSMQEEGVRLNSRPRREALFAVLTAADFPSVLIEVGFLSNAEDRAVLATAGGRGRIINAIADTFALLAR